MEFRPRPEVKGYSRCRRTRAPLKIKSQKLGPLICLKKPQIGQKWLATHRMKILLKGSVFCCKGAGQRSTL